MLLGSYFNTACERLVFLWGFLYFLLENIYWLMKMK